MLPVERELATFKFIEGLSTHLQDVREPHKALADLLFTLPKLAGWDLGVL